MRLHCLHADAFSFGGRSRDDQPGSAAGGPVQPADRCVVAFVAIEPCDTRWPGSAAAAAADRIRAVADQLGEQTVVLFPTTSLTDRPADDAAAKSVFERLESELADPLVVPYGEDTAFSLDARGHPFASQQFRLDSTATSPGKWLLAAPDGSIETSPELPAGDWPAPAPTATVEPVESGPPLLARTDDGTVLRPAGVLVRDLVVELLTERLLGDEVIAVEYLPDRSGPASPTSLSDWVEFGSRTLPVTLLDSRGYDPPGGPGTGPLVMTAGPDTPTALEEAVRQAALIHRLLAALNLAYEPVVRATDSFLDAHADWLSGLSATFSRPLPVDRVPETGGSKLRIGFAVPGADGSTLAAPWLTVDGRRETGSGVSVSWLRAAPLGSPVRLLAALRSQTADRDRPALPVWLAPVHLRLVPITDAHVDRCETLASAFAAAGLRVDIDDRDLPVSERLRRAECEWVPCDAVVGDEDLDGTGLGVTVRAESAEIETTPEELSTRLLGNLDGKPRGSLSLPRRHSRHPSFCRSD